MNIAERYLGLLAKGMAGAGGLILVLSMLLSITNLVMRWFGYTLDGWVEASGFVCGMAIGLCLPAAQMFGVDIEVGVMADRLSPKMRRALAIAARYITLAVIFLIGLRMANLAQYYIEFDEFIENTEITPLFVVLCILAGLTVQAVVCLVQLYRLTKEKIS